MTSTYCYQPLSHQRAIRLIMLQPSLKDDAPLSCSLVETHLDQPEDYYALSYTWGGETPSQPMFVQRHAASATSESSASIILVTPNCAAALRRLRKLVQGAGTGVWVDAVSINQAATEEKNVQVGMMADIYRQAKSVIVWLGQQWAPKDRRTISLLSDRRLDWIYPLSYPSSFKQKFISDSRSWVSSMASRIVVKASRDEKSLRLWREAPYWNRAWTLQEAVHVNVRVLCQDSQVIELSLMHKALDIMRNARPNLFIYMSPHQTMLASAHGGHEPEYLFGTYMQDLISLKASDPRDKVFALRSLFPSTFGKVQVDYNRSVSSLFAEATRHMMIHQPDVGWKCTLDILLEANRSTELTDLPSWAVDWASTDTESSFLQLYVLYLPFRPTGFNRLRVRFSQNSEKLYMKGRSVGRVDSSHIGPRLSYPGDPVQDAVCIWASGLATTAAKSLEGSASASPVRTGTMQSFAKLLLLLDFEKKLKEVRLPKRNNPATIKRWMNSSKMGSLKLFSKGRLFFTMDGACGLGPSTLEPGDLICIFSGLDLPFVARAQGSSFILVGPCVVDGVMKGEYWPEDDTESQLTEFEFI